MMESVRVAIACQGGGAQTAFTAGALTQFLERYREQKANPAQARRRFEIVGLSGTSGGAVCAALMWSDLLLGGDGAATGGGPKVARFWKTGYPEGNVSVPLPEAFARDLAEALTEGRLPWLRALDRWRSDVGMAMLRAPEQATTLTPFAADFELKPEYFDRLFATWDRVTAPFLLDPAFAFLGAALRTAAEVPGMRPWVNFWGDVLDLVPLHDRSVIRDGERALIRREFDVLDAFRALLGRYLGSRDRAAIADAIARARAADAPFPELLLGAVDAQRTHHCTDDAWERSISEMQQEAAAEADPEDEGERARAAAKKEALRLEEDDHHLANRTNFRVFRGSRHLDDLVDRVIASACIPTVMRGVVLDGSVHWDGLYSSNPPIFDLPDIHNDRPNPDEHNPEQIWVIRINPMEMADAPDTRAEIVDRRNELAGNLSLMQEIRHVLAIGGARRGNRYYRPIVFGFIDMSEAVARDLDYATKLDKRQESLDRLFEDGYRQAADFFERWQRAV